MVLFKSKKSKLGSIATYGVAMSSLFVVPEIQADVIDITWNGGAGEFVLNATYTDPTQTSGNQLVAIDIDQIFGPTDLSAFNSFFSDGSDNRIYMSGVTAVNPDITHIARVFSGDELDPATFSGGFPLGVGGYAGFRTSNGNVGWFKMDLNDEHALVFSLGQYGTNGETLTVGVNTPLLGDMNNDGFVDLLDVQPFVNLLSSGGFSNRADFDNDGDVTLLDVALFVDAIIGK